MHGGADHEKKSRRTLAKLEAWMRDIWGLRLEGGAVPKDVNDCNKCDRLKQENRKLREQLEGDRGRSNGNVVWI